MNINPRKYLERCLDFLSEMTMTEIVILIATGVILGLLFISLTFVSSASEDVAACEALSLECSEKRGWTVVGGVCIGSPESRTNCHCQLTVSAPFAGVIGVSVQRKANGEAGCGSPETLVLAPPRAQEGGLEVGLGEAYVLHQALSD